MTDHDRDWQNDPAHQALQQWITAWRTLHTHATPVPNMAFTDHIGRVATRMWKQDHVGKIELGRYFAGAGYDGVCPCCCRSPEQVAVDRRGELAAARRPV